MRATRFSSTDINNSIPKLVILTIHCVRSSRNPVFGCLPGGGPEAYPVDLGLLCWWPFRCEDFGLAQILKHLPHWANFREPILGTRITDRERSCRALQRLQARSVFG